MAHLFYILQKKAFYKSANLRKRISSAQRLRYFGASLDLESSPEETSQKRRSSRLISSTGQSLRKKKYGSVVISFSDPSQLPVGESGLISLKDIFESSEESGTSDDEGLDPAWGSRKPVQITSEFSSFLNVSLGGDYLTLPLEAVRQFLNTLVDQYNANNHDPLVALLAHLGNAKNRAHFTTLLRNKPIHHEGDLFATGKHEWMPCSLIRETLIRSTAEGSLVRFPNHLLVAPMSQGQSWLDLFFEFRSDTRGLLFRSPEGMLLEGHVPSMVQQSPGGKFHSHTKGSHAMHQALIQAFNVSVSPEDYVERALQVQADYIYDGVLTPVKTLTPRRTVLKSVCLNTPTSAHRRALKTEIRRIRDKENRHIRRLLEPDSALEAAAMLHESVDQPTATILT